jgi:predicted dehydrogenase
MSRSNQYQAAVVGYGSIGQRHTRILEQLKIPYCIVSRRPLEHPSTFLSIEQLLSSETPDLVIVANETAQHQETVQQLLSSQFKGKLLVEKPLFHEVPDDHWLQQQSESLSQIYVAYNLRYHPIIQTIHQLLRSETVIHANIYAGQYLPQWRPQTDYAHSYSSKKAEGGGVIRDLSHELDYLLWLFGDWQSLVADAGKISQLQIDCEDYLSAIIKTTAGVHVDLHVNYLDRMPRREIVINTHEKTISADFIQNTLHINDEKIHFELTRDDTYRAQMEDIIQETPSFACTFNEGQRVLQLIEALEKSSQQRKWIHS